MIKTIVLMIAVLFAPIALATPIAEYHSATGDVFITNIDTDLSWLQLTYPQEHSNLAGIFDPNLVFHAAQTDVFSNVTLKDESDNYSPPMEVLLWRDDDLPSEVYVGNVIKAGVSDLTAWSYVLQRNGVIKSTTPIQVVPEGRMIAMAVAGIISLLLVTRIGR